MTETIEEIRKLRTLGCITTLVFFRGYERIERTSASHDSIGQGIGIKAVQFQQAIENEARNRR